MVGRKVSHLYSSYNVFLLTIVVLISVHSKPLTKLQ